MAQSDECDSGPLQWATLIIAFISINLTWWIFDIPKLWTKDCKTFFDAVCWQAFRVVFPSVAAVYAVFASKNPHDIPRFYYIGFDPTRENQRMTKFEYGKVIISDAITVIGTIISIYKVCNLPVDEDGKVLQGQWNVAGQVFPTLPVALIGLWLLIVPYIRVQRFRWWLAAVAGGGFLMLALVCVVFSLILVYLSPLRYNSIYVLPIIGYIVMAFPFQLLFSDPRLMLASSGLIFLIRTGQVGIPALRQSEWAPFCQKSQKAFGGVYLAFGILASLLAMWGYFVFGKQQSARLSLNWKKAKKNQAMQDWHADSSSTRLDQQLSDTVIRVRPEVPKNNDTLGEYVPASHPAVPINTATISPNRQAVNGTQHGYGVIREPSNTAPFDQLAVVNESISAEHIKKGTSAPRWTIAQQWPGPLT